MVTQDIVEATDVTDESNVEKIGILVIEMESGQREVPTLLDRAVVGKAIDVVTISEVCRQYQLGKFRYTVR